MLTNVQWNSIQQSVFAIFEKKGRQLVPIGSGFFVSSTVAVTAGHVFDSKFASGSSVTTKLFPLVVGFGTAIGKEEKLSFLLRKNYYYDKSKVDLAVLDFQGPPRSQFLSLATSFTDQLLRRKVVLFSFAAGFHDNVKEIGFSVSCFDGKITHVSKNRKFLAIDCPAYSGSSGGAFVLNPSLEVLAMHLEHVNEAKECRADTLVDPDDVLDEMIVSLKSVVDNCSSGLLALTCLEIAKRL